VTRYIIRRLIGAAVVLLAISFLTFGLFFEVPRALGADPAVLFAGRSPDPATVRAVSHALGLDQPFFTQYWHFLKGIFVGRTIGSGPTAQSCPAPCFGYSFINSQPVWPEITSDLPVDVSLTVGAAILWLVFGVATGVISAIRRRSIFDRATMSVALAGVSLPIYFTGLLALSVFAFGRPFRWLPGQGYVGITQDPWQWLTHMILPWICLAFLFSALYARLTRAQMLETMSEDYIRTARAKGLPESRVITRHGMRAAITPIVTIFGLDVGTLLGGAVLTETVFDIPGIGRLNYDAIISSDFPIVQGTVILAAMFIIVANIVVDILYAYLDPRVRYA
jgi:peptide/nickel transport system permease protein